MARGFINLNRFKHGRAIKQSSKQKANLQGSKRIKRRVFKNVVRGFSLVLHDPKGSHYKIWR